MIKDIALPLEKSTCDSEPIHLPGSIQPHGILIGLEEVSQVVRQVSRNVREFIGIDADDILGKKLSDIFGEEFARDIARTAKNPVLNQQAVYLRNVAFKRRSNDETVSVLGHRRDGLLILEFEPGAGREEMTFRGIHPLIEAFMSRLGHVATVGELLELAAVETRRITGFDRVLIYQFDSDRNGLVVAEDRNERLSSYLGLRFPASDIPPQARELYRVNRHRIIVDADYTPVPLVPAVNPLTSRPTDLTFSVLRSVSPVHLKYMKNMGTAASMSISILRDGQLWGLISCHHKTPRNVPFEVRTVCDFLAQILSLEISAKQRSEGYEYRARLKGAVSRLLAHMAAADNFVDGLANHPEELIEIAAAHGAAIVIQDRFILIGQTPPEDQVRNLINWLATNVGDDVFSTEMLSAHVPEAQSYKDKASGLLSIAISKLHRSYILWFRPEVMQTVKWGGDPHKSAERVDGELRLHPRQSFETWKETVRLKSLPWQSAEIETAVEFRNVIVGIVLRKAEEMAELVRELELSNRELEAFSYSVSHDLRAPFRHIVGYAELLREQKRELLDAEGKRYIDTIVESAFFAGTLVDNLLAFSQMGRASLTLIPIDMNRAVEEVKTDVMSEAPGRKITWKIDPLPEVRADLMMLKLALRNLLANAVKFTSIREEAVIEIGVEQTDAEFVFHVRDNGIGFEMQYVDKLFGVFQRLHRMEEFEGTGIGLANVRRIISRHGGRTWAEGAAGKGATFYFTLPRQAT
jgi:light-regulated signal transduction histidine kinase (bacteriophytochrome)